jgi:hypothetical protein
MTGVGYCGESWSYVRVDLMSENAVPGPGARALAYAQSLGVDTVYDELLTKRGELDQCLTELATLRDKKREDEILLQDREMEILADERGRHPDHSQAAMDRHLKLVHWSDEKCRSLRAQLAQVSADIDGLQYDRDMLETDIKIGVARLQELGGYLQYLASIKQAETARMTREAETQ